MVAARHQAETPCDEVPLSVAVCIVVCSVFCMGLLSMNLGAATRGVRRDGWCAACVQVSIVLLRRLSRREAIPKGRGRVLVSRHEYVPVDRINMGVAIECHGQVQFIVDDLQCLSDTSFTHVGKAVQEGMAYTQPIGKLGGLECL